MKVSIVFPLSALALALAGCSSNNSAPVESADGALSPGIMQPVENTGASNGSWQPTLQPQSMPESMNVSTENIQQNVQSAISQPIGDVQQSAQNAVTQAKQRTQSAVTNAQTQVTHTQKTVSTVKTKAKAVSQDFTIPRDATTNAPIYNQIDKGFYKGDTYTVRKGDTMFLIAYISGMDVKELAAKNNMSEPYSLKVGQVLKVGESHEAVAPAPAAAATQSAVVPAPAPAPKPAEPAVTYTSGPNNTKFGSDGSISGPVKAAVGNPAMAANKGVSATTGVVASSAGAVAAKASVTPPPPATSNIRWSWPSKGRILQGFSSADGGNKGIDIAGSRGQAVNAAASGRVVYAGNALRGYGNLIIIKHNDDYLSAYAHNETILVKDQQQVSAGQQIAKMGSSGTNGVKLHFEIRYKGKSVDPMRYLPAQ
ncbi:murein hydrolase activator NlpD [Pasteurellaceae bacterium HPA106]|uniref:murein hydrolase activator NlpD n=1 Tax=Spirabiliibacterium pneumoniae TaxID=221400 RepID=UPI001AADE09D|nr:murein hydrolase activator NlpD [Spirabiliibacterium pneumoniae]MBE2897143.1 murein hydrolase activator NlpD [Spirabiliibacterium pneumoniae]